MPKRPLSDDAKADPLASGVRAARAWAGLTHVELGAAVGVGPKAVSSWENAHSRPAAPLRVAIARACEAPLWLVEGGIQGLSKTNGRGTE